MKDNLPAVKDDGSHLMQLFGDEIPKGMDAGLIEDDRDELMPPRLVISQDLSDMVQSGQCRKGDIWSQAHARVLSPPVYVVPICVAREWITWSGPPPEGRITHRTNDPNDPAVRDDPESYKNKCHHWIFWVLGETVNDKMVEVAPECCAFTFKRSSMPMGKTFYALVKRARYPSFTQRYRLTSKPDPKRPKNLVPSLTFDGFLSLEAAKVGKALFEQFAAHIEGMKMVVDGQEEEEGPF